jgi:Undecaprenyl-phosphate glucose phosphotransferase
MSLQSQASIRVRALSLETRSFSGLISYRTTGVFVALLDFILIVAASLVAGVTYHLILLGHAGDIQAFTGIGANAALLFILLTASRGAYRTPALFSAGKQVEGIVIAWLVVLLAMTAFLFLLKIGETYSRVTAIAFAGLGLAVLLGSRIITAARLRTAVANGSLRGAPAIVIGDRDELAGSPATHLLEKYGAREVGRFELPLTSGEDHPALQRIREAVEAAMASARAKNAEKIFLALKWNDAVRRDSVCEWLRAIPLPVLLLPDRSVSAILSQPSRETCADIAIEMQRAPLSHIEMIAKRALDITFAALVLVLLAPLLALISLAIKLDSPGPVIFRQRRKGFNGREFTIYKFRTMSVLEDGARICQARRNDTRVTRIGRLLRATSIDELPQLLNVLNGDMSVVGPRPHALAHDDEYSTLIGRYAFRHHVKPGITGWAQVNGFRGETAEIELMKKRVDFDLWYINHWNVWLDFWITMRTCLELARSRNAY